MNVSVCIPVYGVEKYIERCARSLFEQTMKDDIEFIFVDDCTPDKSIEVLQKVLEEYPDRKDQVKIIHHEVNKGLTGARNTALKYVSGDYVTHCDSDDWVDLNLYETMYEKAIEEQADVVCCSIALEFSHRKAVKLLPKYNSIDTLFDLEFNVAHFASVWNKLLIREIACAPDIIASDHITMAEDMLRSTQQLLKCKRLAVCPEVSYRYFFSNQQSVTLNLSPKTFASEYEVSNILVDLLPGKYKKYAVILKARVLLSALQTKEITAKQYYSLYGRMFTLTVSLTKRSLGFDKRVLLGVSFISFSLARFLSKIRLKLVCKIRSGK